MIAGVQLLFVASVMACAAMLVAFVGCVGHYLHTRRHPRRVWILGAFLLGALGGAIGVWRMIPPQWPLSFWATLQATVQADQNGAAVEHYAEGVVLAMTFAAVLGGAGCAGAAALGTRLLKRFAHH